jgi:hypothetical protein
MDQPVDNKWWWLPGAALAIIGLLVLGVGEMFGNEAVWMPVGLGFIVVAAYLVHRGRPRTDAESVEPAKAA